MTQKYKLKVDARKFFEDKFRTQTMTLEEWNKEMIPIQVLDEMPKVYVTFGHEKILESGLKTASLKGWSSAGASSSGNPQGHFQFTVWVDDFENKEYENTKVDIVMDEIQKVLNRHFKY